MTETIADLIANRFGMPTDIGRTSPASGIIAQLLSHRSHRRFSPEPIKEETLQILLAAALSAPSKSDLQQATIIVVRDGDLRKAIEALVPSMPWMAQAQVLLVFCGDNRRTRQIGELRGKPFPNNTLDMFMNAAVDAGLVMHGFITAAEANGLGCCPISVIRDAVEQVGALLALPPGVFPIAALCVGYPVEANKLSMRLPMSVTVHTDRYDVHNFESELAAYDARRAKAEPGTPGKQRHLKEYGEAPCYTWSEDKARQYSVPQRHSFSGYIRKQDFSLK